MTEPAAWAAAEAIRLRGKRLPFGRQRDAAWKAQPVVAPALDFFARNAPGSEFQKAADFMFTGKGHIWAEDAIARLADLLEDWVRYVEAGMANKISPAAHARVEAATDLMDQVKQLLDDRTIHVAAPIVLAGAALEEMLRSLAITHQVVLPDRPGINAYATALRTVDVLTAQEVKEVTAWAGLRNDAAHGRFDDLSRDRALVMADGVNLFLSRATKP
jgi:hypothetical protein